MDLFTELIFFCVFFIPMGILVTLNLLLHRTLPDIAAPWARLAAPREAPPPRQPASVPARPEEAAAPNDEEALEAA
jgi:hypothetical protein